MAIWAVRNVATNFTWILNAVSVAASFVQILAKDVLRAPIFPTMVTQLHNLVARLFSKATGLNLALHGGDGSTGALVGARFNF